MIELRVNKQALSCEGQRWNPKAPLLLPSSTTLQQPTSCKHPCPSVDLLWWEHLQMAAVMSQRGTADDDSMWSRWLNAFAQLTPPPPACRALFPREMQTLLCAHANKAGPGSITYDFSNAFRHIKMSKTYTSVSSLLSRTQLHRHGGQRWLAATHAGHGLAHTFAHMLRILARTGAGWHEHRCLCMPPFTQPNSWPNTINKSSGFLFFFFPFFSLF